MVDLAAFRNNVGCADRGVDAAGGFDGFGRTYPAEELTGLGPALGGWPRGWGSGVPDNVACDGHVIPLGRTLTVRAVTLLGASCGGHLDDVLQLLDEVSGARAEVPFGLPDFLARAGTRDEQCVSAATVLREHGRDIQGYGPRMWRVTAAPELPVRCGTLELPLNPGVHLFGIQVTVAAEAA
ncbi:hypothetical protein [Streptomyces sp. NPDC057052]|uniref:hypothetical protein n=1 Tax=Streptomyces sp. NPDC057052 TaxID=3346010 RepID=UPI00363204E8